MHLLGFIHKDVKPDNIMFWEEPLHAVLVDYGLADAGCNARTPKCGRGQEGTPAYMPGVQLYGGSYGPEVDWHALAIVLYQMAIGISRAPLGPWGNHGTLESLARAINRQTPDLTGIRDPQLKDLLSLLLTRRVNDIDSKLWFTKDVTRHPVLGHAYWKTQGLGKELGDLVRFWPALCERYYGDGAQICDPEHVSPKEQACLHEVQQAAARPKPASNVREPQAPNRQQQVRQRQPAAREPQPQQRFDIFPKPARGFVAVQLDDRVHIEEQPKEPNETRIDMRGVDDDVGDHARRLDHQPTMDGSVIMITEEELLERRRANRIDDVIDENCPNIDKLLDFAHLGDEIEVGNWMQRDHEEASHWVVSRQIGFRAKDLTADPSDDDICSVIVTMYKEMRTELGSWLEIKSHDFIMQCKGSTTQENTLECGHVRDGEVVPQKYVYKIDPGHRLARGGEGVMVYPPESSDEEPHPDIKRQVRVVLSQQPRIASLSSSISMESLSLDSISLGRSSKEWVLQVMENSDEPDDKYGDWDAKLVLDRITLVQGPSSD